MNPLPSLHRSLIPDLRAEWKPPILFYGWSIGDRLQSLFDYAEEHGLNKYTIVEYVRKPVAPNGEKLYDSDSDDGDLSDTSEEEDEDEEPGEVVVDWQTSAQNALGAIAKEAGITIPRVPYWRRPFELRCALHEPHQFVIVLYLNYELDRAKYLSEQDIERMRARLDTKEESAWYVSTMQSSWTQVAPRW